jgi:uroporphyrin-III C-methyltransferase/precorrin-2 dehydrogenase/sirohydrochlorin ferrochelatase
MYPVTLDLRGRPCVVVGAGRVAERKIAGLVAEGASVAVVAPRIGAGVLELELAGRVSVRRRAFVDSDVDGAVLVLSATDEGAVNEAVAQAARARGILVNVADDPRLCDFHLPARVERGALQFAIASGGEAPFVVRRLRELFERKLEGRWARWIAAAARFRVMVRSARVPAASAEAAYDRFFAGTVNERELSVRVPSPSEESAWLSARPPSPKDVPAAGRAEARGFVSLVGAGPGDAGLLTLRGAARLRAADAVVYDRLAARALPCDLSPRVELWDVGKHAGHHPVPQGEINDLLVRLARAGKRVVRLKGGDPYVFGRGAEETAVLRSEGIACEVVSGVTAGIAAPAAAGIAVTSRGVATRVTLLTAHEGAESRARWHAMAHDPEATIVGFMGVSALPRVVAELLAAGMAADTPAAIVEMGTTSAQRSIFAELAALSSRAAEARMEPPAVFVIGRSATYRRELDWRRRLPLTGERIALLSSADDLTLALEDAGAEVVRLSIPLTPSARVVLAVGAPTAWILTHPLELEAVSPAVAPTAIVCCLSAVAAAQARADHVGRVVEPHRPAAAGVVEALTVSRCARLVSVTG